jgi:glycosyltransferase involved in cell wall biosynthesis
MNKIAVITPYYKESLEILDQCHQSVLSQQVNVNVDHFFIADGFPNQALDNWNIKHIVLPNAHDDNGNTPRGIGSMLADAEGYDFIAYLDADNWFHPNHLSSLLGLWEKTRAEICCSFRTLHQLDGTELEGLQEADELSLKHVDTSCYLLHRNAFDSLTIWLKMPKILSPVCDRIFLAGLRHERYRFAFSKEKSVAFRSQYLPHYTAKNIPPPENAKHDVGVEAYKWLLSINGIKSSTKKLGFFPI